MEKLRQTGSVTGTWSHRSCPGSGSWAREASSHVWAGRRAVLSPWTCQLCTEGRGSRAAAVRAQTRPGREGPAQPGGRAWRPRTRAGAGGRRRDVLGSERGLLSKVEKQGHARGQAWWQAGEGVKRGAPGHGREEAEALAEPERRTRRWREAWRDPGPGPWFRSEDGVCVRVCVPLSPLGCKLEPAGAEGSLGADGRHPCRVRRASGS